MIYIIVLNWNGYDDTKRCIQSLFNLDYQCFKVIICDNNSADDSVSRLREWICSDKDAQAFIGGGCPQVLNANSSGSVCETRITLIQTGANLGYAGGNNVAISFAIRDPDATGVWILNNDVVVDVRALSELVDCWQSEASIGIVGSLLVYDHDRSRVQAIGGAINKFFATTRHIGNGLSLDRVDGGLVESVDYPVGASMLIGIDVFHEVGVLCDDYFLYYEEIDFVRRAAFYCEYSVAMKSIVYHKEGGSINSDNSDFADYHFLRSRLIYAEKHSGYFYYVVRLSFIVVVLRRAYRGAWIKFAQAVKLMIIGR